MEGKLFSRYRVVTVAADGSGDYPTLSAAAAAQDPHVPVCFRVRAGVYADRPFLELDDYILQGDGEGKTIFTADVGGRDPWPGETKTGTFRSWAVFLGGGRAQVYDLTVQNTAGDGALRGQALAVYADADEILMQRVTLLANQDTLFTAPLPLQEREKNGFRGPRQHMPRRMTRQLYHSCTIAGNIDFIFGGADAIFFRCRICPVAHRSGTSYITAPSTPEGGQGYLFAECSVQGNCPSHSVYLGRPWRAFARCFWLECDLSDEIAPAGWDNWSNPANERTASFGEAGSTGPGVYCPRAFGTTGNACEAQAQRIRLIQRLHEWAL
ncbi:MAG: pectinesterase family protein [Gemmiger sp.]